MKKAAWYVCHVQDSCNVSYFDVYRDDDWWGIGVFALLGLFVHRERYNERTKPKVVLHLLCLLYLPNENLANGCHLQRDHNTCLGITFFGTVIFFFCGSVRPLLSFIRGFYIFPFHFFSTKSNVRCQHLGFHF